MRKSTPQICHRMNGSISWIISDIIFEQYSPQSVVKVKMTEQTAGTIIRRIKNQIKWDLYNNTHTNKIA